ncbi:MAG: C4-type zinc ribbon domain-containing protein [Bacteroidota bacterium]|nr:C4-type zinc ribbon domain-containing protein [Bacteroidota bacterium]
MAKGKKVDSASMSIEEKLHALYKLQIADSEIDRIQILRGELPLEVQDIEDALTGLQTREDNLKQELKVLQDSITNQKAEIENSKELVKKYEDQQMKVRNNREYESLMKEVEFQKLEVELSEKKIKGFEVDIKAKESAIEISIAQMDELQADLNHKKGELDAITKENEKEEKQLVKKSKAIEEFIEPRLLTAYRRIRGNARNGLAVVSVERDACGGCFNKIPPQRQLDIRSRKKIIVCEFCGRILVDDTIDQED